MRNEETRFAYTPSVDVGRSIIPMDQEHQFTANVGELIPFFCLECLPGDTHKINTSKVVRLQTPLTPFFGNLYLDTYYFYVPSRILWNHWKNFMGESEDAWIPQASYTVPQVTSPSGGWNVGTIADHFGVPVGVSNLSINALPGRAYAMICREWFTDQNLTDPVDVPLGDADTTGSNGSNYIYDTAAMGAPFKVAKLHDFFTSMLPGPQKSAPIVLDLAGADGNGLVPVGPVDPSIQDLTKLQVTSLFGSNSGGDAFDMRVRDTISGNLIQNGQGSSYISVIGPNSSGAVKSGLVTSGTPSASATPYFSNLAANIGGVTGVGIDIAALRTAFQVQKFFEKEALYGSRYKETLLAQFGVECPDYRLQRPEYIGGERLPLSVSQQIDTTGTKIGDPGAFSVTSDFSEDVHFSCSEHGWIIGVCCVRYNHVYQQGLEPFWSRKDKLDFYYPVFANISNQPYKNKTIYAQGSAVVDSDGNIVDELVFGFNEAWADYRARQNYVSGEMRSAANQSLDSWHLGDYYQTLPQLSDAWIREDMTNVDRVLSVTSAVANQYLADFYVVDEAVRPMPVYSIPGLVDHH